MTWVYFLKQKSEAFEKFKTFHQFIENEVKDKIGTLRTDNGGEFTSNEFKMYCMDNGIKRHLTNVYTPQRMSSRKNEPHLVSDEEIYVNFQKFKSFILD